MTTPKQAVQLFDQVSNRLAKITTLNEAKELRDQAVAIQQYVRASNQGRLTANQATYLKLMCERRAGELLAEIPRKQGNRKGEPGLRSVLRPSATHGATPLQSITSTGREPPPGRSRTTALESPAWSARVPIPSPAS